MNWWLVVLEHEHMLKPPAVREGEAETKEYKVVAPLIIEK